MVRVRKKAVKIMLKCRKSKTRLFLRGKTYKIRAKLDHLYELCTELGSYIWVPLVGIKAVFEVSA